MNDEEVEMYFDASESPSRNMDLQNENFALFDTCQFCSMGSEIEELVQMCQCKWMRWHTTCLENWIRETKIYRCKDCNDRYPMERRNKSLLEWFRNTMPNIDLGKIYCIIVIINTILLILCDMRMIIIMLMKFNAFKKEEIGIIINLGLNTIWSMIMFIIMLKKFSAYKKEEVRKIFNLGLLTIFIHEGILHYLLFISISALIQFLIKRIYVPYRNWQARNADSIIV